MQNDLPSNRSRAGHLLFGVLLCLLFIPFQIKADDQGYQYSITNTSINKPATLAYDTVAKACAGASGYWPGSTWDGCIFVSSFATSITGDGLSCNYTATFTHCQNYETTPSSGQFTPTKFCPDGMVCGANPCTSKVGTSHSAGYYDIGTSPSTSMPTYGCDGSCDYTFTGSSPYASRAVGGVRHYWAKGSYTYTGNQCSGASTTVPVAVQAVPSNSCAAGQTGGYFNGQFVCVGGDGATDPNSVPVESPTTTTTTTDNSDGTKTQTNTTTNPDGTKTITTTIISPTGPGTITTVTTEPGNNAQGGARESTQQEVLKELQKPECDKNPNTVGCAELGSAPDVPVTNTSTDLSIVPASINLPMLCPAPRSVHTRFGNFSISYDVACDSAGMIRPVVIFLGLFFSSMIFVGGLRNG